MDDRDSRSGIQRTADAARRTKQIARIIQTALVSGLHGAVGAVVKESLPFLFKLAFGFLIAAFLVPMLVFTAFPNMFFGYDKAEAEPIVRMTGQAMTIGATYLSLEDFENTYIDAMVTSIANDYENQGISIARIEVINEMTEDDLLWLIAINSVSHRQNLETMTAENVRSFSVSRLRYDLSLNFLGEDSARAVLKVEVKRPNPADLMAQLSFDNDAETWAGALYETLKESDALVKYESYFQTGRPNYGGDSGYTGDIQYGGEYENEIDTSGFTDPDTKNNVDLTAYAVQAWENNWGYVWGTFGNVLTPSLFNYKLSQYPDAIGKYADFIRENWLDRRTTDCVGLIKGYGWLDTDNGTINYATNGMPDFSADQMYQAANESGSIETMPEIVGLALWKKGHIGVYIGNGYAIEAMGTKYGVVKTEVTGRGWQGWCKIPFIDYVEGGD